MRPIATDGVAWSVCLSVCLSVTTVSPAKAAELTDRDAVPDVDYRVDPRNHVLDWGPDLPMRRTILRGMTSGFPRMLLNSVPIGCMAAEAVECDIKFCQ